MNPQGPLQPCVVVHGLHHALAVLRAGRPAALLSAPGAALFAGAAWWAAVVAQARAAVPGATCPDVLDCADAPGLAVAALASGQRWLVLDGACPAFAAVARLAAASGGGALPARPPALDLATPGASARLPAWLERGESGAA